MDELELTEADLEDAPPATTPIGEKPAPTHAQNNVAENISANGSTDHEDTLDEEVAQMRAEEAAKRKRREEILARRAERTARRQTRNEETTARREEATERRAERRAAITPARAKLTRPTPDKETVEAYRGLPKIIFPGERRTAPTQQTGPRRSLMGRIRSIFKKPTPSPYSPLDKAGYRGTPHHELPKRAKLTRAVAQQEKPRTEEESIKLVAAILRGEVDPTKMQLSESEMAHLLDSPGTRAPLENLAPLRYYHPFGMLPNYVLRRLADFKPNNHRKEIRRLFEEALEFFNPKSTFVPPAVIKILSRHYHGCRLAPLYVPQNRSGRGNEIFDRINTDYFVLVPDPEAYMNDLYEDVDGDEQEHASMLYAKIKSLIAQVPAFAHAPKWEEVKGTKKDVFHRPFRPEHTHKDFPMPVAYCRTNRFSSDEFLHPASKPYYDDSPAAYPVFHRNDLPQLRKALRKHVKDGPKYPDHAADDKLLNTAGVALLTTLLSQALCLGAFDMAMKYNISPTTTSLYHFLAATMIFVPTLIMLHPKARNLTRAVAGISLALAVGFSVLINHQIAKGPPPQPTATEILATEGTEGINDPLISNPHSLPPGQSPGFNYMLGPILGNGGRTSR